MGQIPTLILILGLCAAAIGALAIAVRFRFAALIIGAMVFFGAIAVQRENNQVSNATFVQPIQLLRAELFLGAAIVLLMGCVAQARRIRLSLIPAQALLFLCIQVYAGFMRIVHGATAAEGAQSVVFAVVTIVPFLIAVPILLGEREGWLALLRGVALAGALWCGLVIIQAGINKKEMLVDFGRRLSGMHGQAQGASQFLCFIATIAVWLVMNDPRRSLRPVWVLLTGVALVFDAWTGSRSGAIMAMIGIAIVLYARAGRAVLLLPVFVAVVFVAFSILGKTNKELGVRLMDTTDTRSVVWRQLVDQFLRSPMFGSGTQKVVENSYLLGLAAYGILMGVLLIFLIVVTWILLARLWVSRKSLPREYRPWLWLVLAINAMYFIGANADGFILARLEATHVILLVIAGYGSALLRVSAGRWTFIDEAHAEQDEPHQLPEPIHEDDEYAYEYTDPDRR